MHSISVGRRSQPITDAGRSGARHAYVRESPERLSFVPRTRVVTSSAAAVHIYVGTDPAHFRALRVFLWSIECTRDPTRAYHVHVMSELAGFDRRGWTTGFTNYRFAIPHYSLCERDHDLAPDVHADPPARAIYCDSGQIFLADPGQLFDLALEDADGRPSGFLARCDSETSVMLIDCTQMASVWTLADAQRKRKKAILARARRARATRGELDATWNARDEEYVPGESKLLHFSTLHTQPWRPFPERFAYRPHRHASLWLSREREAIAAGFDGFDSRRPTEQFRRLSERIPLQAPRDESLSPREEAQLQEVVGASGVESVLELGSARRVAANDTDRRFGTKRERRDSLFAFLANRDADEPTDAVVCLVSLDTLPLDDVAWVVDALFARARALVVARAECRDGRRGRYGFRDGRMRMDWWVAHFEAASRRHPSLQWKLGFARSGEPAERGMWFRQGGRFPAERAPRVWVLSDDRPGNTTQSLGLAQALGWPCEQIELEFGPRIYVPNPALSASDAVLKPVSRRKLSAPWPDVVLAAGRRTAPVARHIALCSRGLTRTVQLGRKGANPARAFDLAVAPVHGGLYPHPNRFETVGALTRITPVRLDEAARAFSGLFESAPRPRVALLVGGASEDYDLAPEVAQRLGREVAAKVADHGGSLFVTTSRRTGAAATSALRQATPDAAHFHAFTPGQDAASNPMLGYLALADVLVVTCESESMLAEAAASGKPVEIYDLPQRSPGWPVRIAKAAIDFVVARSEAAPRSHRGTARPQQGLERCCARLLESGWIRPNRNLPTLHAAMIERGLATWFDGSFRGRPAARDPETRLVAARVRRLMGVRDESVEAAEGLEAVEADACR